MTLAVAVYNLYETGYTEPVARRSPSSTWSSSASRSGLPIGSAAGALVEQESGAGERLRNLNTVGCAHRWCCNGRSELRD